MSQGFMMHAILAAAGLLGFCVAGDAGAQTAFSIDVNELKANGCLGQAVCALDGAELSTVGGVLARTVINGEAGIGVSGGRSGNKIGIGETLRVDIDQSRTILAIKILFLFNGPKDRADKAKLIADGTAYTLSLRDGAGDPLAVWSGPGTVTRCGTATSTGTDCFIITDPFPAAIGRLDFTAAAGSQPPLASGSAASRESGYAIGFIDVESPNVIDLADCAGAIGCPVATVNGKVAFSLNSVQAENAGGSTEAIVIPVRLPDCRYIPRACVNLLPPAGDSASSDDAARSILISLGVIKPLDPSGPNRLNPAAQLLNVKPLLPPEVTSLFDASGAPPGGLPALLVASRWRGQAINDYWFDGFFFKVDAGVVFNDVFEGLIDVSVLTGHELGCVADPDHLLAWDVITTVSELARGTGGRFADTMINVGCINPTKVAGDRLSLYSVNLELARDTFAPTIRSVTPAVTVNNDAVFARLVQSQWKDLGEARGSYACKQVDPVPSGGLPPLSATVCEALKSRWAIADSKVKLCINETFKPATLNGTSICTLARQLVDEFEAALPVAATGPDVYNRLGELKARVDVFQHVWDERFIHSIKPGGFCREWGTCPP